MTVAGVGLGAGAGAGVAYGLDKMGIGTPTQRNWGMVALGALSAIGIGLLTKGKAGASVGAGVAGVGLTRVLASSTASAALPAGAAIRGLGTGEGTDDHMNGPFDQIGTVYDNEGRSHVDGVYDDIGLVVNDYS